MLDAHKSISTLVADGDRIIVLGKVLGKAEETYN